MYYDPDGTQRLRTAFLDGVVWRRADERAFRLAHVDLERGP
jgi:hypothetical protein